MVSNIEDVARLAGVARGTVSNVLNRPDKVSAQTRARVEDAMSKLGYVPNESARVLAGGLGRFIGVLVHDASNPYFSEIVRTIEAAALPAKYTVATISTGTDPERELAGVDLLLKQRAQGALITPATIGPLDVARLRNIGTSVVLVDGHRDEDECSVSVDDKEGGRLAAEHLSALDAPVYAFVGTPSHTFQHRDRLEGFRSELGRRGLGDRLEILEVDREDIPSGTGAAQRIAQLAERGRVAVFCGNDLIAIGLTFTLPGLGIRVPDDVALCGYDDIDFARYLSIPLTSIAQPMEQMGKTAFGLLVDEMTNENHVHEQVRFTPTLRARASSGA